MNDEASGSGTTPTTLVQFEVAKENVAALLQAFKDGKLTELGVLDLRVRENSQEWTRRAASKDSDASSRGV